MTGNGVGVSHIWMDVIIDERMHEIYEKIGYKFVNKYYATGRFINIGRYGYGKLGKTNLMSGVNFKFKNI